MRRLLPLLALLTGCVEDLPERRVLIPPPDRGIPIPPPFRPDAFRGWGGGDGDAGELDAGETFDLGRGPDATAPDHQVGDARPDDAGELDAGDGLVEDAGELDAAIISGWITTDTYMPVCETAADCVADEVCGYIGRERVSGGHYDSICMKPCTARECPEAFFCCQPNRFEQHLEPFCMPRDNGHGFRFQLHTLCVDPPPPSP